MIDLRTMPIVDWPGPMTPHHKRQGKRYSASPMKTRNELRHELKLLKVRDAFIQGAYREDQLRIDGLPRSGARPEHPGVIVTYTMHDGAMFDLPCDTYIDAEQNLRAIVLTMQRLRLVEESGVKTQGRQYEGFKRLGSSPGGDTARGAAEVLARLCADAPGAASADEILSRADAVERAYKIAATRTHPDRNGGDATRFKDLTKVKRILDDHHAKRGQA